MEQYIKKSALVAEIKKRRESDAKERYFERLIEDNYFLKLIDTLEVKEVEEKAKHHIPIEDIEKAAARYDGSMNCIGCFIGGAKWMEQQLNKKGE